MPISNDEFEAGTVEEDDEVEPEAVEEAADTDAEPSPIEYEKELITSFLSERHDQAFTEREIVLGVDFSPMFENETGDSSGGLIAAAGAAAGEFTDAVLDITGTMTATAIVVNDVDEALAELVEEGTVETKEVDTGDGTTVYYRLAE